MDLEENIRIAFEVYWKNLPVTTELNTGTHSDAFIAGAKSQAAKDYWYNEFKRQKIQSDSGQDQSLRNKPMKPSECFHGKSIKCAIIGVGSQMIIPEPIQSIVPIADVIPEKFDILNTHDNAVEATMIRHKHEMDKPWNIKKEKKVSHKRNNKRK